MKLALSGAETDVDLAETIISAQTEESNEET